MKKVSITIIILLLVGAGLWYVAPHYSNQAPQSNTEITPTKEVISRVSYSCNENKKIDAIYYEDSSLRDKEQQPGTPPQPDGSVDLKLSDGRTLSLPQTISASGIRYANNDESFVFWSKGRGAFVIENNEVKDYEGCIEVAELTDDSNLQQIYSNDTQGFSIRIPQNYSVDKSYVYDYVVGKKITGTKFIIPKSYSEKTNLSSDTYMSIEELPKSATCSPDEFLEKELIKETPKTVQENDTTYLMAVANDAGAGNRYKEIVYTIPGSSPCIAIRYFIHYSVFENYPKGTITEFNMDVLIKEFDSIRKTLIRI